MRYKCQQCLKEVGIVRFDLDAKERKQLCNKCYFAKDNKDCIITTLCHKEKNGTKTK